MKVACLKDEAHTTDFPFFSFKNSFHFSRGYIHIYITLPKYASPEFNINKLFIKTNCQWWTANAKWHRFNHTFYMLQLFYEWHLHYNWLQCRRHCSVPVRYMQAYNAHEHYFFLFFFETAFCKWHNVIIQNLSTKLHLRISLTDLEI